MRLILAILFLFSISAQGQIINASQPYRPFAVVAADTLLLDTYSGAAAAYSLRKLRTAYTGSAIRVRRSNDNTEQNIGFTSAGDLDTASLKTFVGANSGFVTTWYDQSGNARNATQTTATNQPRIVNAGTVERRSGDISLVYDGSNDFLEAASTSGLTISPTSFYAVSSRGNSANTLRAIFSTGILSITTGYGVFYADNTILANQDKLYNQVRFTTGTFQNTGVYTNTLNTNNLLFSTVTTTTNDTWYNGGNNQNQTFSYSNNTTERNIIIGAIRDQTNVLGRYLNGTATEIVIWSSNQTSNRTGIETNINSYYGIY